MTSRPGVFAAGDCVDGSEAATVVEVVARALRAAEGIDRYLAARGG
jgi:NADPH-dependent glutamate synthase beta subunit-like oxidoreductase